MISKSWGFFILVLWLITYMILSIISGWNFFVFLIGFIFTLLIMALSLLLDIKIESKMEEK